VDLEAEEAEHNLEACIADQLVLIGEVFGIGSVRRRFVLVEATQVGTPPGYTSFVVVGYVFGRSTYRVEMEVALGERKHLGRKGAQIVDVLIVVVVAEEVRVGLDIDQRNL